MELLSGLYELKQINLRQFYTPDNIISEDKQTARANCCTGRLFLWGIC